MKKSKLSILILVVSIISVYFNFNIISAEDTVDSSIINEDTINNMTIEDINSSNVNIEDKELYADVYKSLSRKLVLPDGYTDTAEEFNNSPTETQNILKNMSKLGLYVR